MTTSNSRKGCDAVTITSRNVWASSYTTNEQRNTYEINSMPVYTDYPKSELYGKTLKIKILYHKSENIRTIYINDICYGTFKNESSFSYTDTSMTAFRFGFHYWGTHKDSTDVKDMAYIIDDVKISKLTDEMITVNLSHDNGTDMPTQQLNKLWIPKDEANVALNVQVLDGYTGSVAVNGETYVEKFNDDFVYKTPKLENGDTVTVTSSEKETEFTAYTSPFKFQYERDDGFKSAVVFGRKVDLSGYKTASCGVIFSLTDPTLTLENEGVYKAQATKGIKVGNYAIELYGEELTPGTTLYYRSYADYTTQDDQPAESAYGEIKSIVIE